MLLINLKTVKESDWDFLVKLRNEPEVRDACQNTCIFTKDEYKKYIENQLNLNSCNRHWIVFYENK